MSLDETENTYKEKLVKIEKVEMEFVKEKYKLEEFLFKFISQIGFKLIFVILFYYYKSNFSSENCKLGNQSCYYLSIFYISSIICDLVSAILLMGFRNKCKYERILNFLDCFIISVYPLGNLVFLVLMTYLCFNDRICGNLRILVLVWITLIFLLLFLTIVISIFLYCFRKNFFIQNYKKIFFYMEGNSYSLIPIMRKLPDDLRDAYDQNQLVIILEKNIEAFKGRCLEKQDFEMLSTIDNIIENLKIIDCPQFEILKDTVFEFMVNLQNNEKNKILNSCLMLEKLFRNVENCYKLE